MTEDNMTTTTIMRATYKAELVEENADLILGCVEHTCTECKPWEQQLLLHQQMQEKCEPILIKSSPVMLPQRPLPCEQTTFGQRAQLSACLGKRLDKANVSNLEATRKSLRLTCSTSCSKTRDSRMPSHGQTQRTDKGECTVVKSMSMKWITTRH